MMKTCCKKTEAMLDDWFSLSETEREAIRAAADGCAECRKQLRAMLALAEAVTATRTALQDQTYRGELPGIPPARLRLRLVPAPVWSLAGLAAAACLVWMVLHAAAPSPVSPLSPPVSLAALQSARPSMSSLRAPMSPPTLSAVSYSSLASAVQAEVAEVRRKRPAWSARTPTS